MDMINVDKDSYYYHKKPGSVMVVYSILPIYVKYIVVGQHAVQFSWKI